MSKFDTSNLYAEMDRKRDEAVKGELRRTRRKLTMDNLKEKILEYSKIFLLFGLIIAGLIWKHDGNIVQNTIDYFENFTNPDYVNRGKQNYQKDVILESKESQTLIPVIEVQGQLKRDGSDYIIFQYNNKVYTKTIGESFADEKFRVSNITKEEIEVVDTDGNFFYYSLKKK